MRRGSRSGLEGNLLPIQVLGVGVLFEIFFVEDEDGTNDSGVVLKADLGDKIRYDVEKSVGVDDGEGGRSGRGVGDILVSPFGKILNDIRQKLELVNQVRKFGGMDLGEFGLQDREAVEQILHNAGSHPRSSALGKKGNLGHGFIVRKAARTASGGRDGARLSNPAK